MKYLILFGKKCDWESLNDLRFQKFVDPYVNVIKIYTLYELKEFLDKNKTDKYLIFPIHLNDARILNNVNISNIFPSNHIIDTFNHKKRFSDYVLANDLVKYIPNQYYHFIDSYKADNTLVIVKKGNQQCFGYGVSIQKLCDLDKNTFDTSVVQEYIYDTTEYAAHCVCENGYIKTYNIFSKKFTVDEKTPFILGVNCKYKYVTTKNAVIDKTYLDMLEQFILPSKYTGICCIDFKIKNNKVYIFEINPRVGGSIAGNLKELFQLITHLL